MWKGLLPAVALMAILLPLSDGIKRCNPQQSVGVCFLKPEVGPCRAAFPRYYYNSKSGRCQRFTYGGCGGNANNFNTLSRCQQKCMRKQNVCSLKPEIGRCRARIPRYFYNSKSKQCQRFFYGGCGGNGNNFKTLSQCQQKCMPKQNVCSLKPKIGRCRARIPRYFYNSKTKQCYRFFYGGCGGNGNNFKTLSQCQQKCYACPVKGQVFTTCGRPCTFTCGNVKRLKCVAACKPGCDCPRGQVIDRSRNKCVPTRWCPKSKPGSCPLRRPWIQRSVKLQTRQSRRPARRYHYYCRKDSQCSGRKKCCYTHWGSSRKSCVTPIYRIRRYPVPRRG